MTVPSTTMPRARRQRSAANKHLGLMLASELLVVPLLSVQEIVGLQEITPVPRMPGYLRGIINLRGRVLSVVDLRLRLGVERATDTKRTCIVVSQIPGPNGTVAMGLLVDQVTEVLDIAPESIDPPPDLGGSIDRSYLAGVARLPGSGSQPGKVALILDLARLLGPAVAAQESAP
jgi:purine-binding chemotaxis protein CheW